MLLFMGYLICQMAVLVFAYPRYNTQQIMAAFFGMFYVAVMLSYIYQTRILPGGIFTVWLVFVCSWGCDTCAYCVGMLIGKHKMAPVLSPKKSIEGGIGGIAGAALIGVLYALAINHWAMPAQMSQPMRSSGRQEEPYLRWETWQLLRSSAIIISKITGS